MQDKKYIALGVLISFLIVAAIVVALKFMGFKLNQDVVTPPPVVPPGTPGAIVPPPVVEYVPEDGAIEPIIPIESQADFIIDITPVGFSPETLRIKKGDSVIWTSRDKYNSHQIVSTGTKYPESGDCGTKMDSCETIELGESFRATFNVVGTWTYADKLHPQYKGTVIVE